MRGKSAKALKTLMAQAKAIKEEEQEREKTKITTPKRKHASRSSTEKPEGFYSDKGQETKYNSEHSARKKLKTSKNGGTKKNLEENKIYIYSGSYSYLPNEDNNILSESHDDDFLDNIISTLANSNLDYELFYLNQLLALPAKLTDKSAEIPPIDNNTAKPIIELELSKAIESTEFDPQIYGTFFSTPNPLTQAELENVFYEANPTPT